MILTKLRGTNTAQTFGGKVKWVSRETRYKTNIEFLLRIPLGFSTFTCMNL